MIEKIHTISEHCEDDENETIIIDDSEFNYDILYWVDSW